MPALQTPQQRAILGQVQANANKRDWQDEFEENLPDWYQRATGIDYDAARRQQDLANRLRGIASGVRAGPAELAARRQAQEQAAGIRSMAAGQRGYAGGSAGLQAGRNLAVQAGRSAGAAGLAGLQDAQQARALEAQLLAGLQQRQLVGLGQMGALAQGEEEDPSFLGTVLPFAGMALGGAFGGAPGAAAGYGAVKGVTR